MVPRKDAELEGVIGELRDLARRKPLPAKELDRAKGLMVRLREMGFTNREVSHLTDGGWSEPTVKLYTRGSTVKDPSPKNEAIKLLTELVDMGLSLNEVKDTISVVDKLRAKDLTVEDVSSFLEEARKFKVDVKEVFSLYKDLKASNLTVEDLRRALAYKVELESAGLMLNDLAKLSEASKAYGGFNRVVDAVDSYGGLEALKAEVSELDSKRGELKREIEELKNIVKDLEERKASVTNALRTYEELKQKGFDDKALNELRKASSKYGGVNEVLSAINAYESLKSLESFISEMEKKKADVEAEVKRINAEHAYLQTIIGMCESLLYKYKFSISAINDMYELAKRYGKPLEVLKAIGKFGDVKALESEIDKLSAKKGELEARVKELDAKAQELRGMVEEIKLSISGALKPLSNEVKRGIESITAKYEEAISAIVAKYDEAAAKLGEFFENFGKLKAEAGKLEEELNFARNIQALIKYPTQAKDLPLDYDILMLRAVTQHCTVKNVNPKVKAGDKISKKYYGIYSSTEVELLDLLEWATKGLISSLGG